ncbi:hypothetical protein KFE25_011947 [Diacronema lutheri]|uniref:Uncharacterized protein n=1 Tax=Diacronema lutheri TaxID=2081491 RepID=A0A8J5X6N0_DIALT|nr:hypothetical protein KFE25_011947 [Diacronema lutheri]
MQLAKSFATRTQSPLLVYLANAQFLGLAGLWGKVCSCSLPPRCSKRWYFETFCGVPAVEFEARGLDALDETADIGAHLKGFVKPYDVCALMMALPFVAARPASSAVTVGGVQHSLLLSAEQQIDVWNVHNLLRDVYHVVAMLDVPSRAAGPHGSAPRRAPLHRRVRDSGGTLVRGSASTASASVQSASLSGRGGPVANPHLARLTAQLAVSAGQSAQLGRQSRARGALGAPSRASVGSDARSSDGAHGGSAPETRGCPPLRRASRAATALWRSASHAGGSATSGPTALWGARLAGVQARHSAAVASDADVEPPSLPESLGRAIIEDAGTRARASGAGVLELRRLATERALAYEHVLSPERVEALLSLALRLAQGRQRRLEVVTLTVGGGLTGIGVAALLSVTLRSHLRAHNASAQIGAFWLGRLALAASSVVVGGTTALLSLQPLASQRRRLHALVLLFNTYVCACSVLFLLELTVEYAAFEAESAVRSDPLAIGVAIGHLYSASSGFTLVFATAVDHWRWRHELESVLWLIYRMLWVSFSGQAFAELTLMISLARVGLFAQPHGKGLAVLAFLPVAFYALGTAISCAPSFRERMRAALMVRLGTLGALEALAPLAGYGTDADERSVSDMCTEALRHFHPVLLDERALRALDDAWTRAEREARAPDWPRAGADGGAARSARWSSGCNGRSASRHVAPHRIDVATPRRAGTQRADAYVVHAWADEPAGKLRALREYARTFAREHGRPPAVWIDALCAPRSTPPSAPRRLRASARLNAVATTPAALVAGLVGATLSPRRAQRVAPTPAASAPAPAAERARALDTAEPSLSLSRLPSRECAAVPPDAARPRGDASERAPPLTVEAHKRRLSLVVQIATVVRINSIMRSLLNPLHAALDAAERARLGAGTSRSTEAAVRVQPIGRRDERGRGADELDCARSASAAMSALPSTSSPSTVTPLSSRRPSRTRHSLGGTTTRAPP